MLPRSLQKKICTHNINGTMEDHTAVIDTTTFFSVDRQKSQTHMVSRQTYDVDDNERRTKATAITSSMSPPTRLTISTPPKNRLSDLI